MENKTENKIEIVTSYDSDIEDLKEQLQDVEKLAKDLVFEKHAWGYKEETNEILEEVYLAIRRAIRLLK